MTRRRDTGPPPDLPRLRLRTPMDVLATVPYVVGFHPTDSLVVLGLRARELRFSLRVDLPPLPSTPDTTKSIVDHVIAVVRRQACSGVLLVGYGGDARVRPVVDGIRRRCAAGGPPVLDALRADQGRFWSYLCTVATCCPPEGSPYDLATTPAAAAWTVAGMVALPDRQAYEEQLRPVDGPDRASMRAATARAHGRLMELLGRADDEADAHARMMAAGRAVLSSALERQCGGARLDDDEVGWLTVLLMSADVRDVAWSAIRGTPADVEPHRNLWMDVLRRAEPDLVAAPGSLFAYAAWRCGEGTLARLAVERVLDEHPRYALALSMASVLASGLPPSAVRDIAARPVRSRSGRRARRRSSSGRAGSRRA